MLLLFLAEGKNLAISFGAKFIETSAGLQHNVDELLVGVLKQIRLRLEMLFGCALIALKYLH